MEINEKIKIALKNTEVILEPIGDLPNNLERVLPALKQVHLPFDPGKLPCIPVAFLFSLNAEAYHLAGPEHGE